MNRSLLARRSSSASLLALVLAGCRAAPTPSAPQSSEAEAATKVATAASREPTLRYLRTEKVATTALEPARYIDVFELCNETPWTFVCSSDGAGNPGYRQEVRVRDGSWQPPYVSAGCGFVVDGDRPVVGIEPAQLVRLTSSSWLRRTRALLTVRRSGDDEPFVVSTGEFDSSLAAPGETPPQLIWDNWDKLLMRSQ